MLHPLWALRVSRSWMASDEAISGGARFIGDGGTRKHTGNLFTPRFGIQRFNARRNLRALGLPAFRDAEMMLRAGGNLGRMGNDNDLHRLRKLGKAQTNRFRHRT